MCGGFPSFFKCGFPKYVVGSLASSSGFPECVVGSLACLIEFPKCEKGPHHFKVGSLHVRLGFLAF